VGIARGLAADPDILLMDEPFGAIDPINREKLQEAFLEIQDQLKKTIVFVTHDIREAIKLGDKIAIFNQGKLVQYDDTEEIVRNPKNEFVEDLLGSDRALRSLEIMEVRDYYKKDFNVIELIDNLKVKDVLEEMKRNKVNYLFVVDKKRRVLGYVSKKYIEKVKENQDLSKLIKETETVSPHSNLLEAMTIMMSSGLSVIPVVNDRDQILGVLHLRDLLDVFNESSANVEEKSV
jgi:osmoprotectant transport system ATP-binding protein